MISRLGPDPSLIAMVAFGLLLHDPDGNLSLAVVILALGGLALYGTAFVQWLASSVPGGDPRMKTNREHPEE
jgi:hypothetical protein